ncbi:MAG: SDR family NAD(P)-dependent oxidoreductase, partial [Chloroflexota bacterium]
RAQSGQVALWHAADISRPNDVESMVQRAVQAFGSIDILVCNAGVIGAIGPVETTDWDDWVTAIQVNLLGTVLCCRSVVPIMRQQQHGKIIALSGGGATSPIAGFSAYGASKAGLVRFIETLAVELEGTGIDVNAVAPGTLDTQMLDQTLEAGPERLSPDFLARSKAQKASGGTPLQIPANLITFLASSRSNGITGRLISAVWDDWEHLAERKEQLRTSDVFTLRRIVPSDRGWDG